MSTFFGFWDATVESAAVIIIVVIAIGLMVGLLEPALALTRIAMVLGGVILLLILPAIISGIWHTLSLGQQLGIIFLLCATGAMALRISASRARRSSRER